MGVLTPTAPTPCARPTLRGLVAVAGAAALLTLAACGGGTSSEAPAAGDAAGEGASGAGEYPIEIEHALGTTVIESAPERVATVNWANHEVPLALGVVPVGTAAANFADPDGDGLLPWTQEALDDLDSGLDSETAPVLFDDTAGYDFEAIADTDPDVILAAYPGMTQEDYDTLSQIAPTVAYPTTGWGTTWQETAMFMTHMDPTDLTEVGFYIPLDTGVQFFEDLGLEMPQSVVDASGDVVSQSVSAEQVETFDDVDIMVAYGDESLAEALKADPLLSKIPAVANDAIVWLDGSSAAGTAANPTSLAIDHVTEDYIAALAEAASQS